MKEKINSIIFFGTEWSITSVECLSRLLYADFNVVAVVSLKKRKNILVNVARYIISKMNNKNKLSLKKIVTKNKIPYIRILNINSPMSIRNIKKYNPDLICVCIFGQILKNYIINIPQYGIINMHPSLLPKYRGVDPYFWVIKNAEKETGVTIHYIDEGIDTGDIILQKSYFIHDGIDIVELEKALSKIGSQLMVEAVTKIHENKVIRIPQETGPKVPAPNKSDYIVDCNMNVKYIYNFVKGTKSNGFFKGPIFRIDNRKFFVKDAIKYEIFNHNKFPEYLVQKEKLIFYAIDGIIILKIETSIDKLMRFGYNVYLKIVSYSWKNSKNKAKSAIRGDIPSQK